MGWLAFILLGSACANHAQTPSQSADADLGGTSWQLVRFQGSDDSVLTPDDGSRYTIAFDANSGVSSKIDCNRGHGTWKSAGPNQLEFGPMALTRTMCPPAPLNDRVARDWPYVRSYMLKEGHLFLSLMADGGIYEYEPMSQQGSASGHIKGTAAYRERMALPPDAAFEATLEDVSRAGAPADVVGRTRIEHPGNPPIAFDIAYDPAKINEKNAYTVRARITVGDQLLFTTAQNYPVLTRNNGNEVTLLLLRTSGTAAASAAQESALQGLPATFVGKMPCADCPGIDYRINLNPDHTFSSHMTYEERNATLDDNGHWELAGNMLVLHGSHNATDKFAVRDADTLRKLDMNGNEIVSEFNYDLKRTPQAAPGESQAEAAVSLENTHWDLTALGDASIAANSPQTEAFFVLDPEQRRVSGSGGCNRLTGSYEINGDQLKFGQMAGTMMMCPRGMDTEQAFLKSLELVNKWKITGQSLELLDAVGKVLAQFKAEEK
jgi:heat shock protein HslJ/uncharacterized lipoprotein YbaY